jgi:putative lipoprotein
MRNTAIWLLVLGGLAACGADTPGNSAITDMDASGNTAQVTGTLTYRERIFLPPGVVAEVWLLDTSLADAPAVEIAYQKITDPGNPPIPFVLEYDTSKIQEGMQYSIRAAIRLADQLLFTSDTHYPVLTRGAGNTADVLLIMVDDTTN